jgi:hypothetical protein
LLKLLHTATRTVLNNKSSYPLILFLFDLLILIRCRDIRTMRKAPRTSMKVINAATHNNKNSVKPTSSCEWVLKIVSIICQTGNGTSNHKAGRRIHIEATINDAIIKVRSTMTNLAVRSIKESSAHFHVTINNPGGNSPPA